MAEAPAFGRLVDLAPREAWGHEAHAFTPWLAENIDRLAEAVGMELELTGQEVRVERFAADILARDPSDDSVVLIENQLEATDHTHLGQILTYLAGLDARTVIWITPEFREPHLSAVRWLNEHTAEGFSFFAVRLRVVRIGESAMAPVFEVMEKPNGWERRLAEARLDPSGAESRDLYERFWQYVAACDPEGKFRSTRAAYHFTKLPAQMRIVSHIGAQARTFVENNAPTSSERNSEGAFEALDEQSESLAAVLKAHVRQGKRRLCAVGPAVSGDQASWNPAADWMIQTCNRYLEVLTPVLMEIE